MKLQDESDGSYSLEDNLRLEADAHDEDYDGRMPFGLSKIVFSPAEVWAINDHAFKRGTYRRGWRKRRLFQLMDLPSVSGKRILEVGCGQGHNAVFFAMYGADVHGFDLSPKGIEMAQQIAAANKVGNNCHFQVANVSQMPFPDGFFDAVVYNAVLHHVIKYPNVKEETYRVLKSGGKIFLAEGVRDNQIYRFIRRLKRALKPIKYHGDIDLEMSDLKELCNGYENIYFEQFGLIEKFVHGIGRDYSNGFLVRTVYWLAHIFDVIIFAILPFMRRQGLEVVGVATKP